MADAGDHNSVTGAPRCPRCLCRDKRSKKDKTEQRAKTVLAELPGEVR